MHARKRNVPGLYLIALLAMSVPSFAQKTPINRFDVVNRHNVTIEEVDPMNPLSVGNGDFAFTVDATGLQSFEDYYYKNGIPLETLSNGGWHSFPNTQNYRLEDTYKSYDVHGRQVPFAALEDTPAARYFRINPHRIPLGQIGLDMTRGDGSHAGPADIKKIRQELNLWTGLIRSNFELDAVPVQVETVCHPELDLIAVQIKSPLIKSRAIKPTIRFAYSHDANVKNKPPLDWKHPEAHQTNIKQETASGVLLERILDDSRYYAQIAWVGGNRLIQKAPHEYILEPGEGDTLTFVVRFSPEPAASPLPTFEATKAAGAQAWEKYWTRGGIIDLSGCTDPRAAELERRVILSLYQMKVQFSGTFPPQESGLTHISWYGKHNTEMYGWHVAHFAQWGRIELMEKSMAWYQKIMPVALALAKEQGFEGARWPKMCGIDGRVTPGTINPFIIWNEPHIIYLSELCYRAHPDRATLEKYRDLVSNTAQFMASYAYYDQKDDRYVLGPPIRSANEANSENTTKNPTYELAAWYYGLSVAQQWRERLGLQRDPKWALVMKKLSRLPARDGLYLDIETDPNLYNRGRVGSSMMLMALGVLPETPMVDPEIMHRTLLRIIGPDCSAPSWRMGVVPMTAARLGEVKMAVDLVCDQRKSANHFLLNGLVPRPKEPRNCPAYLPINGAFLSAVGLMTAGWDGAPNVNAPGFPQDGTWNVRWEGLQKLP